MQKIWSSKWVSSSQVRKQRKYRHNSPLHVRHNFFSAHLASDLRKQYRRRSFPLRKGDEVQIMRGKFRGTTGMIEKINMKRIKVYVDTAKVKRTDGREVTVALEPSNIRILRLNLSDKKRLEAIQKEKPEASDIKENKNK